MAEGLASLTPAPGSLQNAQPRLRVEIVYGVSPAGHQKDASGAVSDAPQTRAGELQLRTAFSLSARRNVLFGPSGVGKSTLLRLIAGLLQPSSGTISLGSALLTDTSAGIAVPAGRRGIGYLTQEPALFPHLSVEANIAYGLHALPRNAQRARLAAVLDLFSLEPLARRMPPRLSGGERQRVALARALAPEPSLLLLDEAFAGLDAPLREKTAAALEHYSQTRETTVLAVSHDVAEVYSSDAEVLLLENGRITQQGPSQQVLAPHREHLLRQLGSIPLE